MRAAPEGPEGGECVVLLICHLLFWEFLDVILQMLNRNSLSLFCSPLCLQHVAVGVVGGVLVLMACVQHVASQHAHINMARVGLRGGWGEAEGRQRGGRGEAEGGRGEAEGGLLQGSMNGGSGRGGVGAGVRCCSPGRCRLSSCRLFCSRRRPLRIQMVC